jgi:hypothetical protein
MSLICPRHFETSSPVYTLVLAIMPGRLPVLQLALAVGGSSCINLWRNSFNDRANSGPLLVLFRKKNDAMILIV